MAPRYVFAAVLLSVSVASGYSTSQPPFWTYTSRFAESTSIRQYTYTDGDTETYTNTYTLELKTGVTPTATPTSTTRDTYYYDDMLVIEEYYPTDAVAASDFVDSSYYNYETYSTASTTVTSTYVTFYMPVTIVAPASCPTPFTVTTTETVSVPTEVRDQVTPTSTETSSRTTVVGGTEYHFETWYLSEGAAPFTTSADYYYEYYIEECSTPPGAASTSSVYDGGSSNSDGSSSSSSSYRGCNYYWCEGSPFQRLNTWIIIIATIIPGLFLLGLVEGWFWFRRLMMGKSAMRFGTVCWIVLSLWVLCFTRMQDARSPEDQVLLRENWKAMSTGAALKAWLRWQFRRAYPVPLLGQYSPLTVGIVPAGEPLHPAMAQVPPPGFYQPPPGAMPPPGQPGMLYHYDPNQGYVPQAAGYFGGDMSKGGMVATSTPVPPHPQFTVTPPPQAPQQAHTSPSVAQDRAGPPQAAHASSPSSPPLPPRPQQDVPVPAPAPSSTANETPAQPLNSSVPLPKNDPNDRSLYE
ncbi:hypothetical protein P153DRAFT_362849 [Dothidotthia symphoricarpi CBS 119687]|uniref:Uncharacterized protein n=1 Tax=Dothidotthia symphoricarpi CBS 119687 TaxID=1392245 RepID=A0A6A6ARD8_9PLEO|nr:uncharacterized protein P153DRAFT_362849 [Dothidotthia symphoricarpi CBS 119687]KAF2133783.1 hypothetical protein P153DRAFT_362849 [Dothidotthia symphoricarpi CBS 119687]